MGFNLSVVADGSANTIRPTGITYPEGFEVTFGYGAADSIHDQCSLVSSLIDSDTGATHLADYQYLGLGTVVLDDSPQADLRYTLVSLTGSNDPDTGDIYAGLDRFGRVKDLRWRNTDTGSDLSRVLYGYDRGSSRIWRENPSDSSRRFDWLYGYDGLHRLHSAERGELNSGHTSITSPQFGQCWTLDPTGNWHGFRQDDDGNSTWDLIQARTSNPVNEITDIDNTTGSSWAVPSYDASGNMTTIPRPDLGTDKAMTATWDAWNRLAKLVDPSTSDTLAEFAYDGRNFRVVGKSFAGGTLDETRHYYFTDSWQCLEERIDSSTDPERQHVWGIRYIDDLVLRDRDTTGNGTLDERLYFLPDANWNVTAVVDESGAVQERIEYTPYGWPQFLSPTFGARSKSSFDVRYTYTSREWEGALGLYYFRNRWYAPTLGVFCSRDPIGYEDGVSLYRGYFVPMDTDFRGMKTCRCICRNATGGGLGGASGPKHHNLNGVPANVSCETACETKSYRRWGLGGVSVRTCKADPRFTPGIKICRMFVEPGTFCADVINACGGQHTYIQFGAIAPDGSPLPGTTGIGFSGPGLKPPAPEPTFNPTSCSDVSIPKGMTYGQAVACIRAHAPTKPYTDPRNTPNPLSWYMCGQWAAEAIQTCELSKQNLF